MSAIVLWYGQADSPVLDPYKEKLASNLQQMNGNNMQDEEDWVFASAGKRSLLLAPAVSLNNRYKALGMERQESVDNDSDPERDNHIKMVQRSKLETVQPKKDEGF